MCGVTGIARESGPVADELYANLLKLTHRAHDTAGAVTSDHGETYLHRGMGEVANVFTKQKLESMKGSVGIGHVRWTTVGDMNLNNAHPLSGVFRGKNFYIGHNGQINNIDELERQFPEYHQDVTTDTKFIAALISFSGKDTFEEALQYACSILKGTYSLVILYDDKIYAVRDTTGNRPLVLGVNGNALMVSSETVAFNPLGGRYIDEVHPGEIVTITKEPLGFSRMSIRKVPDEMPLHLMFCLFEMIYLLHPASIFLGRTVQLVRERMGMELCKEHPLDADVIVGIPDSGLPAARGYARASGIQKEVGIIRSHYAGRIFIGPIAERKEKHRIKHDVIREIVDGKKVVIVDDSIVEGATSQKIVALLRQSGAKEIYLLASSPPPVAICHFGVPTAPMYRRLIAADHKGDVEAIRKEIGADYLGYLSISSTIRSVIETPPVIADYPKLTEEDFCTSCFTGRYQIPIL
ncbi:MAG: amidophosphoribosyltransferase [Patescibacteria group bacterium]